MLVKQKKTFGNVKEQKSLVFYTYLEILLMLIVLEGFQPHLEQGIYQVYSCTVINSSPGFAKKYKKITNLKQNQQFRNITQIRQRM